MERLKEDNGKVATNKSGEIITENDFAYLDVNGEKSVYKREKLNDGDYWIKEPISTLESILFKKKMIANKILKKIKYVLIKCY